ncbi:MAG: hypothetical protein J3R72DRAFT_443031 [Linnemannia gamsii]|nr:MAG: hypothetical protein J3R72DRAFT_443031 [Linnemannia gamsii]
MCILPTLISMVAFLLFSFIDICSSCNGGWTIPTTSVIFDQDVDPYLRWGVSKDVNNLLRWSKIVILLSVFVVVKVIVADVTSSSAGDRPGDLCESKLSSFDVFRVSEFSSLTMVLG